MLETNQKLHQQQGVSPLGTKTKSASPSNEDEHVCKSRQNRRDRYELVRTARQLYAQAGKELGLKYVLNYHRTAKCKHVVMAESVDVLLSKEHSKAFYAGLVACGCVWTCPVCAEKIQERRRLEIKHAIDYFHQQENKTASMITLTFSHKFGDDLKTLLDKQKLALKGLRSGKAWDSFKEVFGFEGLIRSLELTYGSNGYHPHTHELWFIDKRVDKAKLDKYLDAKFRAKKHHVRRDELKAMSPQDCFKELLLDRWEYYCNKVGLMDDVDLSAFRQRAVDVKHNVSCSEYLAKQDDSKHWGADREIAKASSKAGKKSGMHPFNFLVKLKETGEAKWAARWLDYSKCMKGKSQIFWSHGLKDRIGLDDLTDEEVAERFDDKAEVILRIEKDDWNKVTKNNAECLILEKTEDTGKKEDVLAVVQELPT